MSLGPHMTRLHLSISKALVSVLKEVAVQDQRSLSNLIEHGMREWVSTEIGYDRYRHLETGRIKPPPAYRANPEATLQNVSALNKPSHMGPRKNQYADGTYLASPEGRKYAELGRKNREREAAEAAAKEAANKKP